jgi:hypothetical protein
MTINRKIIDDAYFIALITVIVCAIILLIMSFAFAYSDGELPQKWYDNGQNNHGPWQYYRVGGLILNYHWCMLALSMIMSFVGVVIGIRRFAYSIALISTFVATILSFQLFFWLID